MKSADLLQGKSKTLSDFFRVARNTLSVYFPDGEPAVEEVEVFTMPLFVAVFPSFPDTIHKWFLYLLQHEYWRLVQDKSQHVSIQTAHVDTKACGSAFPTKKESPYSRYIE